MKQFLFEGPMWRRSAFACGAMLGACSLFVGFVLLISASLVDSVVSAGMLNQVHSEGNSAHGAAVSKGRSTVKSAAESTKSLSSKDTKDKTSKLSASNVRHIA